MTSSMTTNLDTLDIQSKLSKTWRVLGKHEVVYTGGHIVYSRDHTHMVCIHGEDPTAIIIYRLSTGQVVHQIDCGEDDPIATFTLSPNQQLLYTAHIRSGLVKCWNIETKELSTSWKAEHKNDVVVLELDPTGTLLASASLDQSIKIRYANNGHLTHQFFNHGSPITTMVWHPNVDKLLLAVGTQNGTIRVHWLGEGSSTPADGTPGSNQPKYIDLVRQNYDGTPNKSHFSKVTSLSWSQCQTKLISVGYDKTWRVWDFCTTANTQYQQSKQTLQRSFELMHQLQPQNGLVGVEIASYLALDDLEAVKIIPYGTPVPIRKKDTNQYVTKTLDEDNTGAIYFMTTGQRGVTTIWKLTYDYINKKKSIGLVFKHTSLQSYSTQNIPYNDIEYKSKLYAVTTMGPNSGNNDANHTSTDNDFQTPLHLQWHKMSLYLPPSLLQLQQPTTNKVITLKDGRTITKPVPSKTIVIPQLPALDSDKVFQQRLLDEMKFYDSQNMLQREQKYRRDARIQLRLENNMKMIDGEDDAVIEEDGDEKNDKEDEKDDDVEVDEDEKNRLRQIEISKKMQEFRGLPPSTPQVALLNGDHNLYLMDLSTFDINKIFSLYSLQINDVKIIPNSRCVIVATNSNQLRIFNIDTLHCSILFPHRDVIVSVTVSSCGRFVMSSTTKGEIFVWVLYHYDTAGFIPLHIPPVAEATSDSDSDAEADGDKGKEVIPVPVPFHQKRLASHISAHIVAELQGHTEAPSALAFSHNASPSFEQRLVSHNNANNKIENPQQALSKYITVPTVYNYNRLLLFACTGGSDKTVKTWNLSSLYIFVDPTLFGTWHQTSQYYKSALLSPPLPPNATPEAGSTPNTRHKVSPEQIITMSQPDKHLFVQLADKTVVNASYIIYHNLLYSSSSIPTSSSTNQLSSNQGYTPPPTRIVFTAVTTTLAHEKDINAIVIHPNNTTIATCAEDKTCKLWKFNHSSTLVTSLQLLGVLKGHRRTVWQVIFTPREKFIITVSGDKLIKVWSTVDFSCVQTLQGHTAPIVQINWLRHGLQFMTGDASGILRLWNLYDNNNGECVSVCDEPHDARINGLDIDHYRNDSFMVTGDTAAKLVFWHDTTLYDEMLVKQQEQSTMLLTQLLENAIKHKDLLKAFELALKLNHPRNLYQIISDIIDNEQRYKRWKALKVQRDKNRALLRTFKIKQAQSRGDKKYDPDTDPDIVGQDELYLAVEARENLELRVPKPKITIKKLISIRTIIELETLLGMILDWNTNSKFSYVAQFVLFTMMTTLSPDILANIPNFKSKVDIFISYSQRHYTRTTNLLQSSYIVDHVLSNMNIYMPLHEQDRAKKVLEQQTSLQEQAQLFGGNDTRTAADWLFMDANASNSDPHQDQALQHILSLQVDDSLLQYEDISDDEEGLGAIADKYSKSRRGHSTSQVNYYYGSNVTDPYASSDSESEWTDDDEDDEELEGGLDSFGDWDNFDQKEQKEQNDQNNSIKGNAHNTLVQLPSTKSIKSQPIVAEMPAFDSTWGDFDDDWEAMANAGAPVVEEKVEKVTKKAEKVEKKIEKIEKVEKTTEKVKKAEQTTEKAKKSTKTIITPTPVVETKAADAKQVKNKAKAEVIVAPAPATKRKTPSTKR